MVRRPIISDASVPLSSSSTSPRMHTPPSDSDRTISRQSTVSSTHYTPSSSGSYGITTIENEADNDPDVPLPSIEGDSDRSPSINPHDVATWRPRNPSFSITPPASEGITTRNLSSSTTHRTRTSPGTAVDNLNERIENLRMSTASTTSQVSTQSNRGTGNGPHSPVYTVTPRITSIASVVSNESNRASHRSRSGTPHSEAVSLGDRQHTPNSNIDGISNRMENIAIGQEALRPTSLPPVTSLHPESPSPERATRVTRRRSSTGRRRSSSQISQPHNVSDEEPPQEPFHGTAFQQAFAGAKRLVTDLSQVLGSSSLHNEPDSRIQGLYNQARALSRFECPSTRTVAFVGDSGVGKSSLINSLLDVPGLARTSNSGSACTCVVTEFHYHNRDDFVIVVEYFAMEEFKDQLTELLQAYRRYHLRDPSSNDGDEGFKEKADVARDTFRAAFGNRLTQNEQFLIDQPEETVLERLFTWIRELSPTRMEGTDVQRRETIANAEQCSISLMELTSEPSFEQVTVAWPFIRKINVYLKAHILSKGLILVDLPGLRDLNSARLKITERYMLNCHGIFAICNIGRANSDVGVEEVFELARRANLSNIGIICTKSDDIRANEAERDWGREAAATIRRMREEIVADHQRINDIKGEIEEFEPESDAVHMSSEDREELLQLYTREKAATKTMDNHERELKSHLINTRNQKVIDELQQHYQNRIPGDLKVFCVSNTDYWKYREKPREQALPFLLLSRIIDVRRHCISIVAQSQERAARGYMTDVIPAFLGSVELWVQSGAGSINAERRQAICNCIQDIEKQFQGLTMPASLVNVIARSMEQQFNQQVWQLMRNNTSQWSQAAGDASLEWHGWSHATYSAFCRKYGDYSTAMVGRHRWNDEAMEVMATYMATPWQNLCQTLQSIQYDESEFIKDTFERAISLSNPTGIAAESLMTLTATLKHRQQLLLSQVELLCEEFEDGLSALRTDAFSGIRSSIMGQLMEASYRECNHDSGLGSDKRRKTIVRNRFLDEILFKSIRRQLKSKFSKLANNFESKVQEAVATHLSSTQNDLDTLKNENAALEADRYPEFRRRVETEVARVRQEMTNIQI